MGISGSNTLRGPFGVNKPITTKNVGTVASGSSVVEYGDGVNHQSVITVDTTLGAIAGGAALGLGKLVYTFPSGAVNIRSTYMSIALSAEDGNIDDDTPDVGVGSVIASGVVSVLGGTLTFEDMLTGQTAADCNGTATVKQAATSKITATGDAHTVYLNVADDWAASGETACPIAGTIIIDWCFVV